MNKSLGIAVLIALSLSCASQQPRAPLRVEACEIRFHGLTANVGFLTYLKYELQTDKEGRVMKVASLHEQKGQESIFTTDALMACLKRWRLEPDKTYTLNMDLSNAQPLVWDLWLDKQLVLSLTWDDKCNRPIPAMMLPDMPVPPDVKMPDQRH